MLTKLTIISALAAYAQAAIGQTVGDSPGTFYAKYVTNPTTMTSNTY